MKHDLFIVKHSRWFIIIPIVITLLMLLPLRMAKINPDLMEYLPDDIPAKINIDKLEAVFGKYDPVILLFETDDVLNSETLKRIQTLNTEFARAREIEDVISLFEMKYIRGENGAMLVDPVVKRIPSTDARRETLRAEIVDNPLAYNMIVSDDFRYTIMLLNPATDITDQQLFDFIEAKLVAFPGKEKVYRSGIPYLRNEIQHTATRDLAILMPIGFLVMMIFLYFSFREKRGVLLPLSVVGMSIVISMGLMPLLGYDLSLIAVLVPIMMIAIANNYGVHLIARYQELNAQHPRWGMKRIVNESFKKLYIPIILTALTTIVGILGLVAHIMIPAKQMGIVSAVGVFYALLISLFFIPAFMSRIKKGKVRHSISGESKSGFTLLLKKAAGLTTKKPMWIAMVFLLVMGFTGIGISRLQVSINLDEMMPKKHDLRQSTSIFNRQFGGTKTISLLFEGDIKSPEVMQEMDRVETALEKIPEVGNVTSLASVIRIISKALNEPGSEYFDRIPDQRDAIAQYIEFYSLSGSPDDFEQMVNFDYTQSIATVQFKANNYRAFKATEKKMEELVSSSPHCTLMAGQCLIEKELSEAIVRGQIWSLLLAFGSIVLLLGLIFRSVSAGFMGAIPLVVSLVCNFGLMGWLGIQLDIATSLLSSIAIGIGVDYTIHLFWRLKHELHLGRDWNEAVSNTLQTTGRGIAINAFSVMAGFAVLFFSGLTILKTFGFLIIFSLLLCLLSALILIPALVVLGHPSFLTKQKTYSYENNNNCNADAIDTIDVVQRTEPA